MTCDEAKNMITISVFGKPDPTVAAALQDHLSRCPSCARIYKHSAARRSSFDVPDDLRMPDWDRSWDVIARRSIAGRQKFVIFGIPGKWAFAAAALLTVFILGFFAGRKFLRPVHAPVLAQAAIPEEASPLRAYADSVEPILIDFLNRGAVAQPPEMAELKKKIIRSMIEETRLLKSLAEQSQDVAVGNILDELETALVSLSNLKPGDRESAEILDRTIRDRRMRSKLRELSAVRIAL
jgi:hypothetical protein